MGQDPTHHYTPASGVPSPLPLSCTHLKPWVTIQTFIEQPFFHSSRQGIRLTQYHTSHPKTTVQKAHKVWSPPKCNIDGTRGDILVRARARAFKDTIIHGAQVGQQRLLYKNPLCFNFQAEKGVCAKSCACNFWIVMRIGQNPFPLSRYFFSVRLLLTIIVARDRDRKDGHRPELFYQGVGGFGHLDPNSPGFSSPRITQPNKVF